MYKPNPGITAAIAVLLLIDYGNSEMVQCFKKYDKTKPFCSSEKCEKAAIEIYLETNLDANPCFDFYQVTCGGHEQNPEYIESIPLTGVKSEFNNFLELLLKPNSSSPNDLHINHMKDFFRTCLLKQETLKKNSQESIRHYISMLNGWQVLTEGHGFIFNWKDYLEKWMITGTPMDDFFTISPSTKPLQRFLDKNLANADIKFSQTQVHLPRLSLPAEILARGKDDKLVKDYFNFMVAVTKHLSLTDSVNMTALQDILDFEISLAKFIKDNQFLNEPQVRSYSKVETGETERYGSNMPWKMILNHMCDEKKLPDEPIVEHFDPSKMDKFTTFIIEKTTKSPRIAGDYVIWKAIEKFAVHVSPQINEIFHTNFNASNVGLFLNGHFDETCMSIYNDWTCNCLDVTKKAYFIPLNYQYRKRYVNTENLNAVSNMTLNIQNSYVKTISHFIKAAGNKDDLITKIKRMKSCLNFHDEISSAQALKEYYAEAPTDHDPEFGRWYMHLNAYNMKKAISKCASPFDEYEACKTFVNMNQNFGLISSNIMVENKMLMISPRFIESTGFSTDLPDYINYTRLGFYIARLIALFLFKVEGEHVELRYQKGVTVLEKSEKCIKTDITNKLSADLETKFEPLSPGAISAAIIDNIAISVLQRAFLKAVPKYDKLKLPIYRFENCSPQQLFWICFGTWMCDRNDHTNRFRVRMDARLQEDFTNSFGCVKGTPMNPENKCLDFITALTSGIRPNTKKTRIITHINPHT